MAVYSSLSFFGIRLDRPHAYTAFRWSAGHHVLFSAARRFLVLAAFFPAARPFLVLMALLAAARRFFVRAAFCPAVKGFDVIVQSSHDSLLSYTFGYLAERRTGQPVRQQCHSRAGQQLEDIFLYLSRSYTNLLAEEESVELTSIVLSGPSPTVWNRPYFIGLFSTVLYGPSRSVLVIWRWN